MKAKAFFDSPSIIRTTSPPSPAAGALAGRMADYVGDMLAIAEARFEARLRALEARMLETHPPAPSAGPGGG